MPEAELDYGSDLVVELLLHHGIEVVAFNPGATFRGIHDSLVHRGRPRIILATHEEIAVAIAHGYAKASGGPMAVLLHDVVGLQHATMAIYNAWVDRVPILLIGGTGPKSTPARRPWVDWVHTASSQAEQIRHYIKWDDEPVDLASVPAAFARAMQIAQTHPKGPVYVNLDVGLQEQPLAGGHGVDPELSGHPPAPPAPRPEDVAWLVQRLRTADFTVIATDYAADDPTSFRSLLDLVDLTGAVVLDGGNRLNFPTRHPHNVSDLPELFERADFVLAVEVEDLYGRLRPLYSEHRSRLAARAGVEIVHATTGHFGIRSWAHAYQRLVPVHRTLSASAAPLLSALVAAFESEPIPERRLEERRRAVATATDDRMRSLEAEASIAAADDAVPPERLAYELGIVLKTRDFVLANGSLDGWERRLWDLDQPGQHVGWHGGGGLGYGLGASIGVALATGHGTICVDIQPDGDLLYTPSALWTAAREELPLLIVMHNNRQYENTVGHAAEVARQRNRRVADRYVGAGLTDPTVDFALLARAQGMIGIGPVMQANGLRDALEEAVSRVEAGRPALVDVWTTGS